MKKITIILIALLTLSTQIFAQSTSVSNETPQWEEKIEISYSPDPEGPLSQSNDIYVRLYSHMQEYETTTDLILMERKDTSFQTSFQIKKGTAAIQISFQSKEEYDRKNALLVRPIDQKGKHYKNAYAANLFSEPEEYKQELANFPQNYVVYRHRWQLLPYSKKDSAETIIREEIGDLLKKGKKNESYHYVLTTGHAQLGEFDKARTHMQTLMETFPASPLISEAYSYYGYQQFSQSYQDTLLPDLVRTYIMNNPQHILAKRELRMLMKQIDKVEVKQAVQTIAEYWMEKEPADVQPYIHYAKSLDQPEEQLIYLNKASNVLFDAKNAVEYRYSWKSGLAYTLYELMEGLYDAGAHGQALGFMELYEANAVQKESYVYMLKGKVLQALNNHQAAMTAYVKAADMGSEAGLDSAKVQYTHLNCLEPLDVYLHQLRKELFENEVVSDAPSFAGEDLEGHAFKLEDLKGKVVVLNFWFIGCAPCRIEMPGLNEMVKDYQEKEKDVEFISFALDASDNLKEFLASNEFAYRVIPEAFDIANQYGVNSYPTHVIIDREGKIRSTLTGGSAERHHDIQPLIDRILAFSGSGQ